MPRRLVAALLLAAPLTGCGDGKVKEESINIEVKQNGLDQARTVLQRYADGQPVTSEVSMFPEIVKAVREIDPAKADVLDAGFKDIQKSPAQAKSKATALLKQIAPNPFPNGVPK